MTQDRSAPRDQRTPLSADHAIRQAIQSCWMMLPAEERSAAKVEEEINRLVNRALKDLREDEEVFGFPRKKGEYEERLARIRAEYPRAYEKWTEEEDAFLKQRFGDGISIKNLALLFQRQPSAIRSRLVKLELEKDHPVETD